jgi:hypothetical protein
MEHYCRESSSVHSIRFKCVSKSSVRPLVTVTIMTVRLTDSVHTRCIEGNCNLVEKCNKSQSSHIINFAFLGRV